MHLRMLNLRRPFWSFAPYTVSGIGGVENRALPIPHIGLRISPSTLLLRHFLDTFAAPNCFLLLQIHAVVASEIRGKSPLWLAQFGTFIGKFKTAQQTIRNQQVAGSIPAFGSIF